MHISRVMPELIDTGRLDPDYYNPVYLEDELKLKEFGCIELANTGKFFAGPFGSKLPSNLYLDHGIPLFRVGNVGKMEVLTENFAHLDKVVHADLKASEVRPGDVLIVKASVGEKICKVPNWVEKANITQHIIALRSNGRFNTDYVCSFLFSQYGVRQLTRRSLGSIIQYLGVNDSRTVLIPELQEDAQKYIGNKVRQAETLRAWAKKLDFELRNIFKIYEDGQGKTYPTYSKVERQLLTDILTASTYELEYSYNQKNIVKSGNYSSILDYFESISNGYDERSELDSGMAYIKVADVRAGIINFESCPRISPAHWDKATNKQKPQYGDLLLTRKGSFGIAAVVQTSEKFLVSSEVFVCKPNSPELMPLLARYSNSYSGQCQFWQFSTGTTMPGISQQNLRHILIPSLPTYDIEDFNVTDKQILQAKLTVNSLITAAKIIVEALIAGKLTEQDLINAQQALDKGDTSLDHNILSRLTTTGIDNNDTTLFLDLDQLYQLLEQADNLEDGE